MFDIRNAATSGFDRAINAMRRGRGERAASDSYWMVGEFFTADGESWSEFAIGPDDKDECEKLIESGDRDFMKFIGVWAHIKAPAEWWAVCGGYFIAQSDAERDGESLTRSVFTTYGHLRSLTEIAAENADDWQAWSGLCRALEVLPESWMIISEKEGQA